MLRNRRVSLARRSAPAKVEDLGSVSRIIVAPRFVAVSKRYCRYMGVLIMMVVNVWPTRTPFGRASGGRDLKFRTTEENHDFSGEKLKNCESKSPRPDFG